MTKKKDAQANQKEAAKKSTGIIFTIGKRRKAVANATIKPGSGKISVNGQPLENMKNDILRMRIQEPFIVMESEDWKTYDFVAIAKGGGATGQSDAVRQAFARGLSEIFGAVLKKKLMDYDRNLLVYDPRRTEPHKPPRSSQGPRRYKQRSKR
ncbi:MAG: 30S ribosomal protein S9 [Candidatus Aenigmarchaeota archaeon]|nr:30S ribosomal protein S9 [Candidatus Aenigmarchaeota archaeon]